MKDILKSSLPCNESLDSQAVLASSLRPRIGGVDRRVAIHVGAILVGKAVHTKALQRRMQAFNTQHMPMGPLQARRVIASQ